MASDISINKPMFSLDSQNKLMELQTVQEECWILFEGLYKHENGDSKVYIGIELGL